MLLCWMWMSVAYMCELFHLFALAVDAFRSKQIYSLLYQVCAATVEHAEAQILEKFGLSWCSIQFSWHTKTIICPIETDTICMSQPADNIDNQFQVLKTIVLNTLLYLVNLTLYFTLAAEVHSPLLAAWAGPPAERHHYPLRSCGGALHGPQPLGSTP